MKVYKASFNLVSFLLIIVSFSYCNNSQNHKNTQKQPESEKKVETVVLPDSLEVYNPFNTHGIDVNELAKRPLKIYGFIDVSCSSCLTNIKNWAKIAIKLEKYDIPVILICQSQDNYELLKYLCEKKDIPKLPLPFYFDTKNQFFKKNKFLNPSPNNNTVLVDKNNLVLLVGDPTLSDNIKDSYFDMINTK